MSESASEPGSRWAPVLIVIAGVLGAFALALVVGIGIQVWTAAPGHTDAAISDHGHLYDVLLTAPVQTILLAIAGSALYSVWVGLARLGRSGSLPSPDPRLVWLGAGTLAGLLWTLSLVAEKLQRTWPDYGDNVSLSSIAFFGLLTALAAAACFRRFKLLRDRGEEAGQ